MLETFKSVVAAIPFSSTTWLVLAVLTFMCSVIVQASRNPKSRVNWEDMFVDSITQKLSSYKVGFVVGVIISTWTILDMEDHKILTPEMFGIYLTYLLGGASWSAWIKTKGSVDPSSNDQPSTP